jgi:tetratricopeptide (TPR) repeat protein/S1-C subfamily serine protease
MTDVHSSYARGLIPLLALLVGALRAAPPPALVLQPLSGSDIYRQTLKATAWVRAADQGKGTGWVLDRGRRLLVTGYHVVGENKTVDVAFPYRVRGAVVSERSWYLEHWPRLQQEGYAVRGTVLQRNPDTDLALVELESLPKDVTELALAGEAARPGDRVHGVGNRYDTDVLWVCTQGSVRQVKALREGYFNNGKRLGKGARVVVAGSPINEGDSGGPLVNGRGEVVGVAAAVAWEEQGAGLFIDVAEVRALTGRASPAAPLDPVGPSTGRDVYRLGLRSLALVQPSSPDKRASGWVVDRERRLLLTTSEAVGKRERLDVTFLASRDGRLIADFAYYREHAAELRKQGVVVQGCVLARDARRNLALLELTSLPEGVSEVHFAAEPPSPGDPLHALGNPARLDVLWVYTAGCVRQLGRANLGQTTDETDPAVVIVQAPLPEGEGGGLLLNDRAEAVGMVSGKAGPQQMVSYCLTADEIKAFLGETRSRWQPRSACDFTERGLLFLKARAHERAIRDFDGAIRLDPKYAPAWSERGRAYHLKGDNDRAVADCTEALRLDDRLVTAYCHRAEALAAQGEAKRALADCDKALSLDRECALAYGIRGDARRILGELDGALADCEHSLWLDRRLPEAHLRLARVLARRDEHDKAILSYTRAVELDPLLSAAYRGRADSRWVKSDVSAALTDYEQALALDPADALAYSGRGRARVARGEMEAALEDFNAAIRLSPRLARAYLERGSVWARRGQVEKALADYTRALDCEPQLAAEWLGEIERRGQELCKEGTEDFTGCCALYRGALLVLQARLADRPGVQKAIGSGLAGAAGASDVRQQAAALGKLVTAVRAGL